MPKKNTPKVKLVTVPVNEETHRIIHAKSREHGMRVSSFASILLQSGIDKIKDGKIQIVCR